MFYGLHTSQEIGWINQIHKNPALNNLMHYIDQIRDLQKDSPDITFLNLPSVPWPTFAVNFMTSPPFNWTVEAIDGNPGEKIVTKIDWGTSIPDNILKEITGQHQTSSLTLVDIPGLSASLQANSKYIFEAVLFVTTSNVTSGTGYGVNFSAAGANLKAMISGNLTATAMKGWLNFNAFNTPQQPWLTISNQSGGIVIKGGIQTGINSGILTIQHLKITSGTSTIQVGSWLELTKK